MGQSGALVHTIGHILPLLSLRASFFLSLRAEGVAISVVGHSWRLLRHFVPRNDNGKRAPRNDKEGGEVDKQSSKALVLKEGLYFLFSYVKINCKLFSVRKHSERGY